MIWYHLDNFYFHYFKEGAFWKNLKTPEISQNDPYLEPNLRSFFRKILTLCKDSRAVYNQEQTPDGHLTASWQTPDGLLTHNRLQEIFSKIALKMTWCLNFGDLIQRPDLLSMFVKHQLAKKLPLNSN